MAEDSIPLNPFVREIWNGGTRAGMLPENNIYSSLATSPIFVFDEKSVNRTYKGTRASDTTYLRILT
jgi:hypothetical protein